MDAAWSFLLFVLLTAGSVKVSLQGANERRLYNDLLREYKPLERPVHNDSHVLRVEFSITVRQIIDMDERKQILTTSMWLNMFWNDVYLQWNAADFPGVTALRFPEHLIWKPDIWLYNSGEDRYDPVFHTNIVVQPSGFCSYIPPGIFKSTCSIDVRWFPFDMQRCELKFGSWTYGAWSLDLQMKEADLSNYVTNGEWDLVEVPGKQNEGVYACCEEHYPDVTFTLVMRRRTLYYGLNLLIPGVLISALAVLVFLLPADSGEKISLGITVLLSLIVLMLLVAEITPATSDSMPLIVQYFATTMFVVGLSVIATVIVLHCHHHDPAGGKVPKWARVFLFDWCAWFLQMKRPQSSLTSMELSHSTAARKSTDGSKTNVESTPYSSTAGSSDSAAPSSQVASGGGIESELVMILEEVRYIAKRFFNQDRDASVCSEWKFAAAVIDRLCLVVFTLVVILYTIGILMSAPTFGGSISKNV
ncbi:neuronal acetylcholine receptor subunit alpha-7-like [Thalassophryne amazonica]|uniref:neuronal acetylcholine receptor subunit alpha-7-like n=1 Tax=Thalassophryne amazonica TaxID=390379 RepID=UPI0014721ED5|nr:neuronal acetylcholine receptor subunit alpha-7-like [Thalassophryne amazonica]